MMKRRIVTAAEDAGNEKLQAAIDELKDNFDFIITGLDLLDRGGAESSNEALILAERFSSTIDEIINELASKIER